MMKISEKKLFLLDLDGTLYLDDFLFEGSAEFLSTVKESGGEWLFLTNNSSKSADAYVEKMKRLGIDVAKDDFLTSVDALIEYLRPLGYEKIYVSGTRSFREQLDGAGFNTVIELSDDIDALVCGYDTELTYKKLEDSCILLGRGVDFIAANPDWTCPTWYGFAPDCGSVCKMLETATGRRPKFIGKPEPEMIYLSLKKKGVKKEEAVLIGDRLYTDIASAKNAGIDAILVLSGETKLSDVPESDIKPDYIFKDIKEILEAYKES